MQHLLQSYLVNALDNSAAHACLSMKLTCPLLPCAVNFDAGTTQALCLQASPLR